MSQSAVEWWASTLTSGAAVAGAFAAVLGLLALIFANKAGRLKDSAMEKFQMESKQAIASAEARGAEASAKAAQAIERAASLERESEELRLKYGQLQVLTSWRDITKNQIKTLEGILSESPSNIELACVANDPEALFVSIKLSEAFTGWTVYSSSRTYQGALAFGITVEGTSDTEKALVCEALTAAGILYLTRRIELPFMATGGGPLDPADNPKVTIFVGSKPRPDMQE